MNYIKNNHKIENLVFLVSYLILFATLFFFKNCIKEIAPNETTYIIVLVLLPLFINTCWLFNLFSKIFFKVPVLKNAIVNFNGSWKGEGKSSHNGKPYPVSITIKQTLTGISINATFDQSASEAFNCSVFKESNKEKIIYNYFNNPNNTESLDKHYGTIILEKISENQLKGRYFTDRTPQTRGDFDLKIN